MMKNVCHFRRRILGGAAAALALAAALVPALAVPVKSTIVRAGASSPETWWVVEATGQGIVISATQSGANPKTIPYDQLESVVFAEPDEWAGAMEAFEAGKYETAARMFGSLAQRYANIAKYEDSYGARARFYQAESLRLIPDYAKLEDVATEIKARQIALSAPYQTQMRLFTAWGHVAGENWAGVAAIVDEFVDPSPAPGIVPAEIKDLPASQYAQVAYLRALGAEKQKRDSDEALIDYYRTFTLNYGTERAIMESALEGAMRLLKAKPELAANDGLKREGHAIATLYKVVFRDGTLPEEFAIFAAAPPKPEDQLATSEDDEADEAPPKPKQKTPEPEEKPAESEEPAAPEAEDAPEGEEAS